MRRLLLPLLAIAFVSCGPAGDLSFMQLPVDLQEATWELASLRGSDVPTQPELRKPTLEFRKKDEQWTVTGFGGCNRFSAPCEMRDDLVRFGPVVSTRMSCRQDSLEQAFLSSLEQASVMRLKRTVLYLVDKDTVLATFVAR